MHNYSPRVTQRRRMTTLGHNTQALLHRTRVTVLDKDSIEDTHEDWALSSESSHDSISSGDRKLTTPPLTAPHRSLQKPASLYGFETRGRSSSTARKPPNTFSQNHSSSAEQLGGQAVHGIIKSPKSNNELSNPDDAAQVWKRKYFSEVVSRQRLETKVKYWKKMYKQEQHVRFKHEATLHRLNELQITERKTRTDAPLSSSSQQHESRRRASYRIEVPDESLLMPHHGQSITKEYETIATSFGMRSATSLTESTRSPATTSSLTSKASEKNIFTDVHTAQQHQTNLKPNYECVFVAQVTEKGNRLLTTEVDQCSPSGHRHTLVWQYPSTFTLPTGVLQFCFPSSARVRDISLDEARAYQQKKQESQRDVCDDGDWSRGPNTFVFTLTGLEGQYDGFEEDHQHCSLDNCTYGVCLLSEELVQFTNAHGEPQYQLVPRCCCLLTKTHYFDIHFGLLDSIQAHQRLNNWSTSAAMIAAIVDDRGAISPSHAYTAPRAVANPDPRLVTQVLEYFKGVRVPRQGSSTIYQAGPRLPRIRFSRLLSPNFVSERWDMLQQFNVPLLYSLVPLDQLLFLVGCLILEHKVIMVSPDVTRLSASVLAVLPLLRPLLWVQPIIPVLPSSMYTVCESPIPLLAGVERLSNAMREVLGEADREVRSPNQTVRHSRTEASTSHHSPNGQGSPQPSGSWSTSPKGDGGTPSNLENGAMLASPPRPGNDSNSQEVVVVHLDHGAIHMSSALTTNFHTLKLPGLDKLYHDLLPHYETLQFPTSLHQVYIPTSVETRAIREISSKIRNHITALLRVARRFKDSIGAFANGSRVKDENQTIAENLLMKLAPDLEHNASACWPFVERLITTQMFSQWADSRPLTCRGSFPQTTMFSAATATPQQHVMATHQQENDLATRQNSALSGYTSGTPSTVMSSDDGVFDEDSYSGYTSSEHEENIEVVLLNSKVNTIPHTTTTGDTPKRNTPNNGAVASKDSGTVNAIGSSMANIGLGTSDTTNDAPQSVKKSILAGIGGRIAVGFQNSSMWGNSGMGKEQRSLSTTPTESTSVKLKQPMERPRSVSSAQADVYQHRYKSSPRVVVRGRGVVNDGKRRQAIALKRKNDGQALSPTYDPML